MAVEMMLPPQIQRLTASGFLPQLTQDEFLLCVWNADTPGNMADQEAGPGGFKCSVVWGLFFR